MAMGCHGLKKEHLGIAGFGNIFPLTCPQPRHPRALGNPTKENRKLSTYNCQEKITRSSQNQEAQYSAKEISESGKSCSQVRVDTSSMTPSLNKRCCGGACEAQATKHRAPAHCKSCLGCADYEKNTRFSASTQHPGTGATVQLQLI